MIKKITTFLAAGFIAIIVLFPAVVPKTTQAISATISSGSQSGIITSGDSGTPGCSPNTLCNPLKVGSVRDLLYLVVFIATDIGVIIAVLAIIWVGFKFIKAQGNPEELKEARKSFYAVVIGIAILIGASAIVNIVSNTLTSAGVVQPGVLGGN